MTPPLSGDETFAHERARLERAHHEICTALTVLGSNVALVRTELARDDALTPLVIRSHLSELELALERLQRLAREMRAWHDEP